MYCIYCIKNGVVACLGWSAYEFNALAYALANLDEGLLNVIDLENDELYICEVDYHD